MANPLNYKQDINNPQIQASEKIDRVFVDEDYVIKARESEYYYGLRNSREFVELHFYIPDSTTLIYSTVIPLAEPYVNVVDNNPEDAILNLELDFWTEGPEEGTEEDSRGRMIPYSNSDSLQQKYLRDLPSGTYDVIINFFADEVGTYNDINWRIKTVSPSRTEIVLHARPTEEGTVTLNAEESRDYEQFLIKSVFFPDFRDILNDIMGVSDSRNEFVDEVVSLLTPLQVNRIQDSGIDFPSLVDEVLQHILYDIKTWANSEVDGSLPHGNRYRIQINRLTQTIRESLPQVVGEHEVSVIRNDSGQIPLIVNN